MIALKVQNPQRHMCMNPNLGKNASATETRVTRSIGKICGQKTETNFASRHRKCVKCEQ